MCAQRTQELKATKGRLNNIVSQFFSFFLQNLSGLSVSRKSQNIRFERRATNHGRIS